MCWATGWGSSGQARVTVALACGSVPARTRAAWVGGAKGERFRSARWRRGVSGRASPWPRRLATRAGGYCWFPVQLFIPPDAGAAALALRQRLVPAPVNSNVSHFRTSRGQAKNTKGRTGGNSQSAHKATLWRKGSDSSTDGWLHWQRRRCLRIPQYRRISIYRPDENSALGRRKEIHYYPRRFSYCGLR